MMSPSYCKSPLMKYPVESLQDMYPEIYHRVYPKVKSICMMMDNPSNPDMQPYPSREMVERMTDNIYRSTLAEMGETDGSDYETMERQFFPGGFGPGGGPGFGPDFGPGFGFGRRRFLRDLIAILLIRELFRRRGMHGF